MSIFSSRKLRVEILVIFLTLFLVSILGITYYSYTRSSEAVLKVANGFIDKINDSLAEELDKFLQPEPLFSIAKLIMNDKVLDAHDMASLSSYMHVVLESYPQLINAYIADTKGDIFVENRVTNKPLSQQLIPFIGNVIIPANTAFISSILQADRSGQESVHFIFKNNLGNVIGKSKTTVLHFDPRARPWYVHAHNNGKMVWIGVYPFYQNADQVVTTAFPVYVRDDFMGVAAADINMTALRHEIDHLSSDANGLVFIVNHSGNVISSEQYMTNNEKGAKLSSIESSKSDVIKTAYRIFIRDKMNYFTFRLDNVKYIAHFKTYSVSADEKWEIATVIPMNVFLGSINHAIKNAMLFAFIILALGVVLVVLMSERLSRPIIQMAKETQDMQHFNFSKPTVIKSSVYEIQVMVNALNIAKSALYSFSKYVPRLLVDQLLRLGTIAAPGGEKKVLTVFFSDIVNFSAIAETMEPNLLMLQLAEYLDVITSCVHKHNGNIDKYIGDGVMAFWGAPQDDMFQVRNACRALLDCRSDIHRLCDQWQLQNKPIFATRFGLNTGPAIVGNLGTRERLNYTAIGDTVNLAARLEEVNKGYDTEIVVSESVYKSCTFLFLFRPVDIVWIVGKAHPVMIYELVAELSGDSDHAATTEQIQLCFMFKRAFEYYHSKRYALALEDFLTIAEQFPHDSLTQLYIRRCQNQLY